MSDDSDFEDEEAELDRLLVKARPIADDRGDLRLVGEAIGLEKQAREQGDDLALARAVFNKWSLIHKYVYKRPFRIDDSLKRSDQWREVAQKLGTIEDGELADWLKLQIEVAGNREKGICDLRIRRDGPCFLILLEYAGNQKRTALAILHWAQKHDEADTV